MTPPAPQPLPTAPVAATYEDAVRRHIAECLRRADAYGDPAVWIHRLPAEQVYAQVDAAAARLVSGIPQPLFGLTAAVKDNIDFANAPTTAACPDFAYTPAKSATAVQRLCDAGAVVLGKTNLDQFATGLVGTRSPYGACRNVYDPAYISGGSSSGSAVAVAAGLADVALGTDTAGSGRVPAAFNNLVGLKPTCGLVSTAGVVPACRSLDCVSVFARTCETAARVFQHLRGYDPADVYSRRAEDLPAAPAGHGSPGTLRRVGIPADSALEFFGNHDAEWLYRRAIARVRSLDVSVVPIDLVPFLEAARLLYEGPWVAERLAAVKELFARSPESLLPVARQIIGSAARYSAVDVFEATYRLRALRRRAEAEWEKMDVLLLPTTGTIYTLAEVEADPIRLNRNLGYYSNFVNLLDLCALALPNGFQPNGLPAGVTLVAPAGRDALLLDVGSRFESATLAEGATAGSHRGNFGGPAMKLAVVGAHLSGLPLNGQLLERNATLVRSARTKPIYLLYALPGTVPPKPGLLRAADPTGAGIEVEVWDMGPAEFGSFVAAIPPPLGIGTIELEDGELVKGFLVESYAVAGAPDITRFGGWRKYIGMLSEYAEH